ncbi:MAG: hypothetical protein ACOC2U_03470 [bacterium]
MPRFNRSKFYDKVNVDGVSERDLLSPHLPKLELKRETSFYTIKTDDIQRPDLLAIKVLGSIEYWWILLYVNNIFDPWNDLEVGQVIKIPNKKDIEDWYLEIKL